MTGSTAGQCQADPEHGKRWDPAHTQLQLIAMLARGQGNVKPDWRFRMSSITQVTQINSAITPETAAKRARNRPTSSNTLISFTDIAD